MLKFTLNDNDKASLIEILLIVGTLLTALELPLDVIWIFMLFVICSLVYFVSIKSKEKDKSLINLMALLSSLLFSAIVGYELGFGFGVIVGVKYVIFAQILFILYFIALFVILYKALKIEDFTNSKEVKKIKKLKKKSLKEWEKDPSFVKI